LRAVIERAAPWFPAVGFTFITIAAVANTALVNTIMGSRMLYGLSRQGLLPKVLGTVHKSRRTPHVAVLVIFSIVAALQFAGDIAQLAGATVLLLLVVFVIVNGALIVLKRREGDVRGSFNAPIIIPVLGAALCLVMIGGQMLQNDWRPPAIAGGLILLILATYVLGRRGKYVVPKAPD
jgi:amino acid transporter